ncbi:MAG TPA: NnrS family protein, partial [Hyphomicrobium sp.]|nr:NnrS family protein [Hyphomicrobium sp.]
AVFISGTIGPISAALLDSAFLLVFTAVVTREVVAGRNDRNIKVVALVLMLAAANIGFHFEAEMTGTATISSRAALSIIVFLILLIGGRIVPSFTHNWLAKRDTAERPVPFGQPDSIVMVLSALALLLWIVDPDRYWTGGLLLAAGTANLWRLFRWRGWAIRSDPLMLVLHAGFFFAALGFLFAAAHAFRADSIPSAVGVHVWAVGAIGTMTLAMMTRATLGHTGRELIASNATQVIYLAVVAAMLARVTMEFLPTLMLPLMYAAAIAWISAFVGFIIVYGPMLAGPVGKRG